MEADSQLRFNPTGGQLVEAAGVRLAIGQQDEYHWPTRTVRLTQATADGKDLRSITTVAHEIAHARQPRWLHALAWIRPVRAWLEFDARLTAMEYWFVGL